MKNGQKSSLYSEEIPCNELFSKIHYIEYPLYCQISNQSVKPWPLYTSLTLSALMLWEQLFKVAPC